MKYYDEIAKYNRDRWEEMAQTGIMYSRPMLDLNPELARKFLDPEGVLDRIEGKRVLCLAGGGGQQSVAFGLLGAEVVVHDLTQTQLDRDLQAAKHYDLKIETNQGDMRDLSQYEKLSFDIVYHAHSINFIPDVNPVFREVARVLKNGGFYRLSFHNPFCHGMICEDWNGDGYPIRLPYVDGEVRYGDDLWDVENFDGEWEKIKGPREFRHTLSTLINTLITNDFQLIVVSEDTETEHDTSPGSWGHFKITVVPYLTFWFIHRHQNRRGSNDEI